MHQVHENILRAIYESFASRFIFFSAHPVRLRAENALSHLALEKRMILKTRKYDVANYLDSDEMIAVYLDAAFESGDTSRIAEPLGDVARARGIIRPTFVYASARLQPSHDE